MKNDLWLLQSVMQEPISLFTGRGNKCKESKLCERPGKQQESYSACLVSGCKAYVGELVCVWPKSYAGKYIRLSSHELVYFLQ